MEKRKKVFVVLSEYNDLNTKPTLVGVFDSEEAFLEGARENIENYVNECYTEEDVHTCTKFDNMNEMIDSIVKELNEYGEVIDPMDDLKVWYYTNPEIQHLDYEGKIREMLDHRSNKQLILRNITFIPMSLDGESSMCKISYITLDGKRKHILMRDEEGDFLCFVDQPLHKQKELYDKLKEKNLL